MAITLEERPIRTCHFGVFHISLGSTLCTESELKSDVALGNVPSSAEVHFTLTQQFLFSPKNCYFQLRNTMLKTNFSSIFLNKRKFILFRMQNIFDISTSY